jgi:hypothetical protein
MQYNNESLIFSRNMSKNDCFCLTNLKIDTNFAPFFKK